MCLPGLLLGPPPYNPLALVVSQRLKLRHPTSAQVVYLGSVLFHLCAFNKGFSSIESSSARL
jgi:hypothetical protein